MEFHSTRLHIFPVSLNYLEAIHRLHSFAEVDRFNTLGIPSSTDVTKNILLGWIAKQETDPPLALTFCIALTGTKEFIGLIGLKMGKPAYRSAELWYKFDPAHWRNGYASEAVAEIMKFCFGNLQLHRLEAGCAVDNTASIKVLEKAGMIREGRKRALLPVRGEWLDNYFYAILDTDFNSAMNNAG